MGKSWKISFQSRLFINNLLQPIYVCYNKVNGFSGFHFPFTVKSLWGILQLAGN